MVLGRLRSDTGPLAGAISRKARRSSVKHVTPRDYSLGGRRSEILDQLKFGCALAEPQPDLVAAIIRVIVGMTS